MKFSYTAKRVDDTVYNAVLIVESKTELFDKIKKNGEFLMSYKIEDDNSLKDKIDKYLLSMSKIKMIDICVDVRAPINGV